MRRPALPRLSGQELRTASDGPCHLAYMSAKYHPTVAFRPSINLHIRISVLLPRRPTLAEWNLNAGMTRPAGLPTLRSQSRHHDRRLPQISTLLLEFQSRCTHRRSLVFQLADLGSGTPACRGPLGRSLGRSLVWYALIMQCGSKLNHGRAIRSTSWPTCTEYRESLPHVAHSMPLHVPHGHVVLCTLLALVGAGWFKCAQITGQGSKYSQQASPRSPLQQGLVQRYLNPHGIHPSCPHSNMYDSLYRLMLSCRSSVTAV